MNDFPIGMFDSGSGGLTVLSACRRILPTEDFYYIADRAFAPYGSRTADYIIERSIACVNRLRKERCKAIVVACNTATNVAIEILRQSYSELIIGVEPALKPAFEARELQNIILLCTPATALSEKFQRLLGTFYTSRIQVSPQEGLASLIENNLCDLNQIRPQINAMLSPFASADAFILGCTHYNFIAPMLLDFYQSRNKTVRIFESTAGTANRLKTILQNADLLTCKATAGSVHYL